MITSKVHTLKPHYNTTYQRTDHSVVDTPELISAGLVTRLVKYATCRLTDTGFQWAAINATKVEVYTTDGDSKPADRSYVVRWVNSAGGYVELEGILTRGGWPTLDHGFAIGDMA